MRLQELMAWQAEEPGRSVQIKINDSGVEIWVYSRRLGVGQLILSVSEIDLEAEKDKRDREKYAALKQKYEPVAA